MVGINGFMGSSDKMKATNMMTLSTHSEVKTLPRLPWQQAAEANTINSLCTTSVDTAFVVSCCALVFLFQFVCLGGLLFVELVWFDLF
eukprot:m.505289 g.505289  ORF g.505289 m.505289 type:complete len:88 (-) comp77694_c0_seq1:70-333(-)